LIKQFVEFEEHLKDGLESFPIALRLINWIKFILLNNIDDKRINETIHRHAWVLKNNLEFHLLGNHLLENAFGLYFAGYYLNDEKLIKQANIILKAQLPEQILQDGGHFELSPMYHQHILFRILDCYNLAWKNNLPEQPFLATYASKMLGWLMNMTFQNGDIPLINDSANKIAPTSMELLSYAEQLCLDAQLVTLNDSGYRKFKTNQLEVIMDVGNIGPDYIPGHAHADTMNYLLNYKNTPIIVDTGTSTYEVSSLRNRERSTSAHNTVEINDVDSSEVWGGFRVAKRAKIISLQEKDDQVSAIHDGYKKFGVLHQRSFQLKNGRFIVEDELLSKKKDKIGKSYLHFHPDVKIEVKEDGLIVNDSLVILLSTHLDLLVSEYEYASEFNVRLTAKKVCIIFIDKLTTTFAA